MANNIVNTQKLISQLNGVLEKHATLLNQSATQVEKLNQAYGKLPSQFIKAQQKQLQTQTQLTQSTTNLKSQTQRLNESVKSKIPTLRQLASIRRQEQRQLEKTSGLYNRVQQAINKVTKKYQDLALRKQLNGKLSKNEERQLVSLQAKLLKYNSALKQVDAQVGRNQRNVGNYRSALVGLGSTLRGLASAFGLTSGVMLFAMALRDSFGRIRDFDKSMQNLSGILGTTRDQLTETEKEIISVAGASIKTSNEVADLAQSLATLGKRGQDLINLIKPANDLSIALQATSDEAGAFLVQTLNAFGEPTSNAKEFANTITAIRTSTTLDFEKMRDAFQYITPIAKILNLDLADTGALVGVLADNGLKAESAGRLLGTALQKIAKEGRTLESALEEINKAQREGVKEYDLLAIASDLFGKQAAKIGIILADNIDTVEASSKSIRENGEALDGLINQQLESLDARLKILDSTWESFLLSLEDGNNIIGGVLKYSIDALAGAIENLGIVTEFVSNGFDISTDRALKLRQNLLNLIPVTKDVGDSYAGILPSFTGLINKLRESTEKTINFRAELAKYRQSVKEVNETYVELNGTLAPHLENLDEMIGKYEDLGELLGFYNEEQEKEVGTVGDLRKQIVALNKEIEESNTTDIEGIRVKQDKIKELQKELNAILGVLKATKELRRERLKSLDVEAFSVNSLRKEIEFQIDFYQKLVDLYPKGSKEAEFYTKKINDLNIALGNVSAIDTKKALAEITQFFKDRGATFDPPKETENNWRDTFQSVTDVARRAFGIISELSDAAFQKQFSDLEKQKENAILFAGESATARAEIERQYDEKRKAIEVKQAKSKKAQALFDITIDTAAAVVRALPNIPLSVIVGALGLAQLAMVASQPIPQFWQGGEVGGSQQIMVNDDPYGKKGSNYKEVVEKPNGQILTPQGRNVKMTVPKGSFVHPTYDAFINSLDSELLSNNIMPVGASAIMPMVVNKGLTKGEVMEVMQNQTSRVVETINKQHGININIDENGINKYIKKKGGISKIMNARYNGKGISV